LEPCSVASERLILSSDQPRFGSSESLTRTISGTHPHIQQETQHNHDFAVFSSKKSKSHRAQPAVSAYYREGVARRRDFRDPSRKVASNQGQQKHLAIVL
jgi:hypothetical protein